MKWTKTTGFLVALLLLAGSSSGAASVLDELARRTRERRRQSDGRVYSDADLKAHHESTDDEKWLPEPPKASRAAPRDAQSDGAYWRREKEKLDRDLARLDDERRRLELRLAELRARAQSRARRPPDPADAARRTVLEGSIAELRRKSAARVDAFLERGRKSGALPGWLR